ncbi:hypothetical protein RB594_006913 [Gaeumannomyces avenae]
MALARSASGPGGLSINTGAANTFGGSTSASTQPPAAGGLFGSSNAPASAAAAPSTSLFGSPAPAGASSAGAATGGGGLFGAAPIIKTPQAQTSTGMFGASAARPAGGGLFGSAAPAASAPATGGLFGSTATAAQPQQPAGGGLFGGAQASNTTTGGGLFGAAQSSNPTTTTTGGGLFGGAQPSNTAGSSFFGGQQQQQQQQQQQAAPAQATGGLFGQSQAKPSLFGSSLAPTASAPQTQPSMFGRTMGATAAPTPGLTMGQSTNQQQVIPGVRIDISNLKSTTRFNDLQETIQEEIQKLDKGIQVIMQQCHDVEAFMPAHGEQLGAIPNDVRFVSRKYEGAQTALSSDAQAVKAVRELVHLDAEQAKLSFKAVDNLKLPAQYHTAGLWSSSSAAAVRQQQEATGGSGGGSGDSNSDLIAFFSRTADEMDEQLKRFQRNLGEIESHMQGVSSNLFEQLQRTTAARNAGASGTGGPEDQVAELASVLSGFEESILTVASAVGGVREGVTTLQLGDFMGQGRDSMR